MQVTKMMTRRAFLAAATAATAVLAAGCTSDDAESGSGAVAVDVDDFAHTWWGVNTAGTLSTLTLNDDYTWEWSYTTEGKSYGDWEIDAEDASTINLELSNEVISFEAVKNDGVTTLVCHDPDEATATSIATSTFYDDEDARDEAAEAASGADGADDAEDESTDGIDADSDTDEDTETESD